MKSELPIFSYQTRLNVTENVNAFLDAVAEHMSHVERSLFAAIAAKNEPSELKSSFLVKFGITARQFNSCRVLVEGKIASIKKLRELQITESKERIESLKKTIEKLEKKRAKKELHLKKRRLSRLTSKLHKLIAEHEEGSVSLCFGSKKLFHKQFLLEENKLESHEEWLSQWQQTRDNSFFLLGSKDETSGNQSCTATVDENNKITLRLRLPNALNNGSKYIEISNVHFKYGHEVILSSIASCEERNRLYKDKDALHKEYGQAISYRFKRDEKGWILFVSTSAQEPTWITRENIGAIGVDINADHLAVAETDRFGNLIKAKTIPLNSYGKSKNQTKADIGDAVAELVEWSVSSKKPLILEELDFKKKKGELKEQGCAKYSRMLSSFNYSAIIQAVKSRAWRSGVKVHQVNPAYTSIIGRVNFANRYGLTIHQSAALCISRRYQRVSEKIPRHLDKVPDGKGGHVALPLPVRNRGKHVWTAWRSINKKFSAVHAAQARARKRSSGRKTPACCDGVDPPRASSVKSDARTVNNTA